MANLSKIKRDQLLNEIEKLKTKLDANDFESLNTLNKLKQEITNKKYGLVWEEHSEKVDEMLVDNIPVFTEDKTREIVSDSSLPYNFLLEGDNLHSLKLLEKTHKGKIDIIYIDPPYNTGKKDDFIYDDKQVDINDSYKHSKWLSFMKRRLEIALTLLKSNGCIFISIDDNEQSALKILCDDLFGESNFIALLPRLTKKAGKNQQSTYASNHDYILCYSKNKKYITFNKRKADNFNYPLKDEYYDVRGGYKLNQTLDYETLGYVNSLDYPITINGVTYYAGSVTREEYENRKQQNPKDGFRWRWCQERLKFGLEHDFIEVKDARIYTKTYFGVTIEQNNDNYYIEEIDREIPITSLDYTENKYSNDNAKKNIDTFQLKQKFNYPKPVSLIKDIISLFPNNAIILDFFAGSGTTAQAVLELNNDDYGCRKFILCTNNQNKICEDITYNRIKKVIQGYTYIGKKETVLRSESINVRLLKNADKLSEIFSNIELIKEQKKDYYKFSLKVSNGALTLVGTQDAEFGVRGIPANLKYYKTGYLPKNSNQNQSSQNQTTLDPTSGVNEITLCDKLQDHIKELIQLETHHNIDDDYYKMILNDADLSNLITNINTNPNLKEIYISSTILLDSNQKQILESKNIKVSEIPDYYFSNELKENGELW